MLTVLLMRLFAIIVEFNVSFLFEMTILLALVLFAQFKEQHYLTFTVRNIARLYQQTKDTSLITDTSTIVKVSAAKLGGIFDQINSENS